MTTDLIPSISIDNLVNQRNAIAERIRAIRVTLNEAQDVAKAALGETPHSLNMTAYGDHCAVMDGDRGVDRMIKMVDAAFWGMLLDKSGLRTFLDAEAREKWAKAVQDNNVPELTCENIYATFKHLYAARGDMFERGVIALFRNLSWDYKTNTPRMFGKRIILTHAVERWPQRKSIETSGVSHSGSNKLDDLVRVFSLFENQPEPDHRQGAYHTLNGLGWMTCNHGVPMTHIADLPFFSLRGFKNGNAHLTFKRLDLVEKMNQILAKHHPNALPPAETDR